MSRHLKDGKVEDLAGNADLAIFQAGFELLGGKNMMKNVGSSLFGKKKKDDFEEEEPQFEDEEFDEEGSDEGGGYDDEEEDEEEELDEEEEEDMFDDGEGAGGAFGGAAGGAMLDRFGMRRKRFQCDIHHIRLTNLAKRRRDVLVIFTLGAIPGEGDLLDEAAASGGADGGGGGADAAGAEGGAGVAGMELPQGDAAGGGDGGAAKGKKGRLKSFRRHRKRGGGGEGTGSTSKPLVFKSDVAAKVERGKTCALRRTFHGVWRGKHKDLHHRCLQMTLVEQTRFGNLVEIATSAVSLYELATGSVQQEVTFAERDGRSILHSYRMNFHVHFQERFTFVLSFVEWRGKNLRATDETGTSDPFLKFSIGRSGSRRKRMKNWHVWKGGWVGKRTFTDVQYNTLFPVFAAAKRPLYYHGTRSDLENETLRIEVWDWDPTSRNDLIGFAEVPLRGVLMSGRISTGLAMYASGSSAKSDESERRMLNAGSLEGAIEVLAEPAHIQFGDVVKRLPKMTYLAVHIHGCVGLPGKKANGMSDPYITARWAATSQQTRVIRSTNAPVYEETLYFPTNLVRNTAEELEAKGDLVLYVLHHNQVAPEDIGFAKISLDKITAASVKRIEEANGEKVKTRAYEATIKLQQQGVTKKDAGRGEIKVVAYFTPDLASDVKIAAKRSEAHALEPAYQARADEWRKDIPYRLTASGRYLCSALDETNTRRFLPTYLCKSPPPREVSDPMTIARMVHSITFQPDAHLVGKQGKTKNSGEELWSSPNYFLDVKKGASEDHAILQCNLFLGLGLDAYIAIGKLPGGIQQHVWVMTREPNGDVKFWETTKGDHYLLPGRWRGLFLDGAADLALAQSTDALSGAPSAARASGKAQTALVPGGGSGVEDKRKLRAQLALAQDKAAREAQRKAQELAKAQEKERRLLYLATEETWTAEPQVNPYETPRDFDDGSSPAAAPMPAGGGGQPAGVGTKAWRRISAGGGVTRNGTELADAPAEAQAGAPSADAPKKRSTAQALPELMLPAMREGIPYETLEVVVNHENVWANLQTHGLTSCGFDIEDGDRWLPFIQRDVWEPPTPPRPFYSIARLGPKLPPQRLSALRQQILQGIKTSYSEWRNTRNMRVRWHSKLESTLELGLATLEKAACSSEPTDQRAVDKWRGELLASLPPGYHFCGRALSFSITTTELIVNHVMTNYHYHENGHKDVAYSVAVKCFAHYGAVASTWVYIGWMTPHVTKKRKKDKEED